MAMPESAPEFRMLKKTYTGEERPEVEGFHFFHELFYVTEGTCSVFIGRRTYRISAGDFAVIPAGTLHKTDFRALGHSVKVVVSFSRETAARIDAFLGEDLCAACLHPGRVTAPAQRREAVAMLLNRMLYEYENQPLHAASVCRACLAELLISILRYRRHEEENAGTVDAQTARMQEVADYIAQHAEEDLPLERLAACFALSPSHHSRTFRKATGFGVREYLISLRIRRACDLLLTTDLTVTEIANRCGFSDPNYFGDAFRKSTGLSPRNYRKLG
ncbi:MAG: helix-turn-helix domain-containing protein [Clostridia bacterium]|nr:helix-turn-helix domain-containing protein [Clostridia bacterium]